MPFPFDVSGQTPDHRNLYLVQDQALRDRVLPLFSFDPTAPEDRPTGHGTAFRIDPWARCATAFHVLEDLFQVDARGRDITLRDHIRLTALEIDGQGYGRLPIPDGAWRPMTGSFSYYRIDTPFMQPARLNNLVELMLLRIPPPTQTGQGTPYLPVKLRGWDPKVGEQVMALGYADLDRSMTEADAENSDRPFRPYLYASVGAITTITPPDVERNRMWPILRVDANWPGAMSGGPVFNEEGYVIGLVSAGFEGDGGATATYFPPWDVPERIFLSLDPNNPNCFINWGAFDANGSLVLAGQDRVGIEAAGRAQGITDFGIVSVNPATEEWMRSSITYATFPATRDEH